MVITSSQVCMGSSEWPQIQEERALMAPSSSSRVMEQAGLKNPTDPALKCPRCDSSNTKFCYYNNYSLSQPRHFCKTCKRYWTRGGTLRNVPVGGGCRKNKRVKRTINHDHGGPSSHLEPTTAPTNTVSLSQPILPPSLPLPSLQSSSSAAITTATATATATTTTTTLQSSIFFNPELHINSSLVSSLKSVLPCGIGFSPKESTYECSFLQDQNGMSSTVHLPGSASLFPITTFPHLGHSADLLNGHISNGMMSEAQWRQVQQQNFSLPLEDLGNTRAHRMKNMGVKIEQETCRTGELDWQVSNHGMFEPSINSEPSPYWNANIGPWPDFANYGSSSVASLL